MFQSSKEHFVNAVFIFVSFLSRTYIASSVRSKFTHRRGAITTPLLEAHDQCHKVLTINLTISSGTALD